MFLEDYPDCVRTFLKVTAAGFDYVAKNPTKSALFLNKELNHPNFKNLALIEESLKMLSGKWLSGSSWGLMNDEVWGSFMDWLVNNKVLCNLDGEVIEDLQMNIQDMYTNSYLL